MPSISTFSSGSPLLRYRWADTNAALTQIQSKVAQVRNDLPPEAEVPVFGASRRLDYELELAIVIGKPAYDICVADAPEYIAGYTIANDFGLHDFRDTDAGSMLRAAAFFLIVEGTLLWSLIKYRARRDGPGWPRRSPSSPAPAR